MEACPVQQASAQGRQGGDYHFCRPIQGLAGRSRTVERPFASRMTCSRRAAAPRASPAAARPRRRSRHRHPRRRRPRRYRDGGLRGPQEDPGACLDGLTGAAAAAHTPQAAARPGSAGLDALPPPPPGSRPPALHGGLARLTARCSLPESCKQMLGGTRFIGLYLARMLVEAGHDVTLLTRGKKPVTARIPDDTGGCWLQCAMQWHGALAGLQLSCCAVLLLWHSCCCATADAVLLLQLLPLPPPPLLHLMPCLRCAPRCRRVVREVCQQREAHCVRPHRRRGPEGQPVWQGLRGCVAGRAGTGKLRQLVALSFASAAWPQLLPLLPAFRSPCLFATLLNALHPMPCTHHRSGVRHQRARGRGVRDGAGCGGPCAAVHLLLVRGCAALLWRGTADGMGTH